MPGHQKLVDLLRQQAIEWVDDGVAEGVELFVGAWLNDSRTVIANSWRDRARVYEIDARRATGAEILWEGDVGLHTNAVAPDGPRVITTIDAPSPSASRARSRGSRCGAM